MKTLLLTASAALIALVGPLASHPASAAITAYSCPADFTALPGFTATGVHVFNTDTGVVISPTGVSPPVGVSANGAMVFTFESISVPFGTSIIAQGTNPLVLLSASTVSIAGTVAADGASALAGGAGGSGGYGSMDGPGSGMAGTAPAGSGGGGFGGLGGNGGTASGEPAGLGGPSYGATLPPFDGGSGGGAPVGKAGGGGGGALMIGADVGIEVAAGGVVSARGGAGLDTEGGTGAGSGGGIVLYAPTVTNSGSIDVQGGFGGNGAGTSAGGGGGGGGRVHFAGTTIVAGSPLVQGGLGGIGGGGAGGDGSVTEGVAPCGSAPTNSAPEIIDTLPADGAQIAVADADPLTLIATFTDADATDTHTCSITWATADTAESGTPSGGSDPGTCTFSKSLSVGLYSIVVSVTDSADNTDSESITLEVVESPAEDAYQVCSLMNAGKAHRSGSTIPVKLQLCDEAGNNASSGSVIVHATGLMKIDSNASSVVEDSGNANPDNDFRYDAALGDTGGYIYNLSTRGLSSGTWRLSFEVDAEAHQTYSVTFDIR